MHTSPTDQRRRRPVVRRSQIRRRRVVALVVLVTLISLAIWVAYAIPGQTPARVPVGAGVPTYARSADPGEAIVVAQVGGVDVLLPVARQATTAVAFHAVDNADAVAFTPVGDRLSGGDLGQQLADIFAGGGGVQYHLMSDGAGGASSSTAGLDIGALPGSVVTSPVDGKVTSIKPYKLLGRYHDVEVDIQLASDPSLLLMITHLEKPKVQIGDVVQAGSSVLGSLRRFPATLDQALSQYTSDTGDHVQLVALRVKPQLAGL